MALPLGAPYQGCQEPIVLSSPKTLLVLFVGVSPLAFAFLHSPSLLLRQQTWLVLPLIVFGRVGDGGAEAPSQGPMVPHACGEIFHGPIYIYGMGDFT